MDLIIRKESEIDYKNTEHVIEYAFKGMEFSDQTEHNLVARLRKSDAFIPELSLVAEINGKIVGHVLLTKIVITNDEKEFDSLALAPLSVMPEYQNKGIGSKLVAESFDIARGLGFQSVIVLGHPTYYSKLGFKPAGGWNIKAPFEVPEDVFMACELIEGGLQGVSGIVSYSKEFFE